MNLAFITIVIEIEGKTYSICTLEFEDHSLLYDLVVNECEMESKPRHIGLARLKSSFKIG